MTGLRARKCRRSCTFPRRGALAVGLPGLSASGLGRGAAAERARELRAVAAQPPTVDARRMEAVAAAEHSVPAVHAAQLRLQANCAGVQSPVAAGTAAYAAHSSLLVELEAAVPIRAAFTTNA
mmetsp:Transcript_115604/g.331941  ORF Transcript_115604/g.331941 Transcript_115604/m.331941 type:complete len:123 (-) Transcript_115604:344-712(-)